MTELTLGKARAVVSGALSFAREKSLAPITVVVLDAWGGTLKTFAAEDRTPSRPADIAMGKVHGALAMGVNSRALQARAEQQPYFIAATTLAVGGSLIPVPIGVLVQDEQKRTIGAVGMTGDTSDNDEAAAFAGLAAANRI
jgi:uncharacterized protein GlcG (DUF336 family)